MSQAGFKETARAALIIASFVMVPGPMLVHAARRDQSAPIAPTQLRVSNATTSSATLAWTPGADDSGVFAYQLRLDGTVVRWIDGSQHGVTYAGLSPGRTYTFCLATRDDAGNWARSTPCVTATLPSDAVRAVTPASTVATAPAVDAGPDESPPSVPTSLSVLDGYCGEGMITWQASTDDRDAPAALSYEVSLDGELLKVVTAQRYALFEVEEEGLHELSVTAIDRAGNRSAAATLEASVGECE